MTSINGSPDRVVEIEGGGTGGGTVDQGTAGIDPWLVGLDPADLAVLNGIATERTLARFVGPYSTPVIGTQATAAGPVTLFTPGAGLMPRVRRIWVKGASILGAASVEFIVMMGATVIAHDEVIGNQPYADGVVKLGSPDDIITLELLQARKVFFNIAVDEV